MSIKIDPEFRALIPPLSPEELAGLEAKIAAEGWNVERYGKPVAAKLGGETLLLDGHNRFDICQRLGLPFAFTLIAMADREVAADWIDENALAKRNLTPDQARHIRGRRYNRTKKAEHDGGKGNPRSGAQNEQHLPGAPPPKPGAQNEHPVSEQAPKPPAPTTAETIAAQSGVSAATIRRDEKAFLFLEGLKKTHPKMYKAVSAGTMTLTEAKRQIRKAATAKAASLPSAKFRIIYADPPWKYGDQLTEAYGATKYHYPSMTIAELCQMPVRELAEDNAVLFLWVTSPLLEESFDIIAAWGFKYKTSFVWDKVKHNIGHYNSVRHEFLLICTRGSCQKDSDDLVDSVQSIERTGKHSEKPEEFRAIIDSMYTVGRRIELFARKAAPGWEAHGNQL